MPLDLSGFLTPNPSAPPPMPDIFGGIGEGLDRAERERHTQVEEQHQQNQFMQGAAYNAAELGLQQQRIDMQEKKARADKLDALMTRLALANHRGNQDEVDAVNRELANMGVSSLSVAAPQHMPPQALSSPLELGPPPMGPESGSWEHLTGKAPPTPGDRSRLPVEAQLDGPMLDLKGIQEAQPPTRTLELPDQPMTGETTKFSPENETAFQAWVKKHGITDADNPDAHYDYRGAFANGVEPGKDGHWPDTYKQHGHETFSEESGYSKGQGDGGTWQGDKFVPGKGVPTITLGDSGKVEARTDQPAPAESPRTRRYGAQIRSNFQPLIDNAMDGISKHAAQTGLSAALGALADHSPEDAEKIGKDEMAREEGRYRRMSVTGPHGVGRGGGAPDKQEQARLGQTQGNILQWVKTVAGEQKIPEAFSAVSKGNMWLQSLTPDSSGTVQQAALISTLKDLNGRAPPQVEFKKMLESAGLLADVENILTKAQKGTLPPALVRNLRTMIAQGVEMGKEKLKHAYGQLDAAVDSFMLEATPAEKAQFKRGGRAFFNGSGPAPAIPKTSSTQGGGGDTVQDTVDDAVDDAKALKLLEVN